MGFGSPLDLSTILPAYREHLGYGGTVGINFVEEKSRLERDPFEHEAIPRSLYAPKRVMSEKPERIGNGPPACSTVTDLVSVKPTFAWDVNGWYRSVGVPWPYIGATTAALSRAYIASAGQSDARATYCLKRLLDRVSRAEYDLMPLGETFMDDLYVQDQIKHRAQAEASRRSNDGVFTEAISVMDEWGFLLVDDDKEGSDNDDAPGFVPDDEPESDQFEPIEWTYAYWVWRSPGRSTGLLERWQTLLVSALSVRGARVHLAVGLMGKQPQDYVVGRFDNQLIVFLNDGREPTPAMAARAADALLQQLI
jgi:hypothetical protein